MLTIEQIKPDLLTRRLGNPIIDIEEAGEESFGVSIRDNRWKFLVDWQQSNILNDNYEYWMVREILAKYASRAIALTGIKKGPQTVRFGKTKLNVTVEDSVWYNEWKTAEGFIVDVVYRFTDPQDNDASHPENYSLCRVYSLGLDFDAILINYLRYTDQIIADLKKLMRRVVIEEREIFAEERGYISLPDEKIILDDITQKLDAMLADYLQKPLDTV